MKVVFGTFSVEYLFYVDQDFLTFLVGSKSSYFLPQMMLSDFNLKFHMMGGLMTWVIMTSQRFL